MKAALAALAALFMPAAAWAHPHIWISQTVTPIVSEGRYTAVEIEWRFDPESSEEEIPPIDENGDGVISEQENQLLMRDTLPSLQKDGFLTWLNTGAKDSRPSAAQGFVARIQEPATFTPPEWNRTEGDGGMKMPDNKHTEVQLEPKAKGGPRNLVYKMRFTLPQPTKSFSITTFDREDFIRVEVDKAKVPAGCALAKHPTYKSEFVPGHPVFADRVSCRIP